MDLTKLSYKVKTLNDYIVISQDLVNQHSSQNVELNMSVILCLKKIRCLEIEYFNKCHESGAAFRIFERLLREPPSKQWSLLGKGLVDLIVYWLDAVRHHLIDHHIHWWLFLKQLLTFTQGIISKDEELVNIVTEELAESFLELATSEKSSPEQTLHILFTFNVCCTNSSREVRSGVRGRLDKLFLKLSQKVARCGHFPTQCSGIECLLRFLVSRQDRAVRAAAAKAWFPLTIYSQQAVVLFLQRPWRNFIQDSRDFLNAQNAGGELVCSVLCNHLNVGDTTLISATDKWGQWVDFNTGSRSVTAFLVSIQAQSKRCDWLTIACDHVTRVTLRRDTELTICISTNSGPQLYPSSVVQFHGSTEVTIKVGLSDLEKVNKGLIGVFGDKYEYIPEASILTYSPHERRRLQSGYVEASKPWRSPSSVSTTSLAHLREKLEALPPYNFDARVAKRQSVIVPPDLSNVTELSETDEIRDSFDSSSTFVVRPLQTGVAGYLESRKAFSDDNQNTNETVKSDKFTNLRGSQSENDSKKKTASQPKRAEHGISALLAVTIQGADKNLLNKSLERVPEGQDLTTDDLTALLVEEALKAREEKDKVTDSGINSAEKKSQEVLEDSSVVIENSPFQDVCNTKNKSNKTPVLDNPYKTVPEKTNQNLKSTSDESNTSVINETPMTYVNVRRGNLNRQKSSLRLKTAAESKVNPPIEENDDAQDEAAVKDFFSQHVRQQPGYVSPTRARAINETSSESEDDIPAYLISSKSFNVNIEQFDQDVEVNECLTSMIDKVCSDLERCSQNLILAMAKAASKEAINIEPLEDVTNVKQQKSRPGKGKKGKPAPKKQVLKIKIKGPKEKDSTMKKAKQNKLQLEPAKTPPPESREEVLVVPANKNKSSRSEESDRSLVRKKRKLYSPQSDKDISDAYEDDNLLLQDILVKAKTDQEHATNDSEEEEDQPLIQIKLKTSTKYKTPQSKASSYSDIEKDRKKFLTRSRKPRSRCRLSPVSPKSKMRNDVFDSLKNDIEGAEKITLVDKKSKDLAVYNFTSDSEDECFNKKKSETKKQTTEPVGKETSIVPRKGKRKPKSQPVSSSESSNVLDKPPKRKPRGRKTKIDRVLEDERMRDAPEEELNTSLVAVNPQTETMKKEILNPNIVAPQVETIVEEHDVQVKAISKIEAKKPARKKDVIKSDKVERAKTLKPERRRSKTPKLEIAKEVDEESSSPLPPLEVETVNPAHDGDDSTVTTNLIQKITKMCENQDAVNDANTTQNLLSENDRVDSPTDLRAVLNITDELHRYNNEGDNDKNEMILAGNSMTGEPLKSKKYSDISEAENENPGKGASKSKECISGSATKKKTLTLKKKTVTQRLENVAQSKDNVVKKVIVEEKNEEIHVTAKRPDIVKSSKHKSTKIEEIITVSDNIAFTSDVKSRSHAKQRSRNRSTSVIRAKDPTSESDIEEIVLSDGESEKSIETDGITAHGDSNEHPPKCKNLKEKFIPRELEEEDMDPDLREYSEALENALHGFNDQSKTKAVEKANSLKLIAEKMLSGEISKEASDASSEHKKRWEDDISRYLPSRRESDTGSESETSHNQNETPKCSKSTQNQRMPKADTGESNESSKCEVTPSVTNIEEVAQTMRKSRMSPLKDYMPKMKVTQEISDSRREPVSDSESGTFKNKITRTRTKKTGKQFMNKAYKSEINESSKGKAVTPPVTDIEEAAKTKRKSRIPPLEVYVPKKKVGQEISDSRRESVSGFECDTRKNITGSSKGKVSPSVLNVKEVAQTKRSKSRITPLKDMPKKKVIQRNESAVSESETTKKTMESSNGGKEVAQKKRKSRISPLKDMPKKRVRREMSDKASRSSNSIPERNTSPQSSSKVRRSKRIAACSPRSNTNSTVITRRINPLEYHKAASVTRTSRTSFDSTRILSEVFAPVTKNISKKSVTSEDKHDKTTKNISAKQKKISTTSKLEHNETPKIPSTERKTPSAAQMSLDLITPNQRKTCPIQTPNNKIPQLSPASKNIIEKLMGRPSKSPPTKPLESETPLKRPSTLSMEVDPKRPKRVPRVIIPKLTLEASGPSISSVNDWLKESELSSKVASQEDAVRETYCNVIEKLNTTLAEIHQNSGRNFRRLFVEAQKQLSALKDERQEIMDIAKHIYEKEKKIAEKEQAFMLWLKQSATDFLLDEMTHKQAMVRLLREDAQAVLDYMDKNKQH